MTLPITNPINGATTAARLRWSSPAATSGVDSQWMPLRGLPNAGHSLSRATVLVAGAGAVGGGLCQSLARMGVGLILVDPDEFGVESHRTQWCERGDVGQPKSALLAERLRRTHPTTRLVAAQGCVQDLPWQLLSGADVLVCAGDNLQMLVWMGRLAAALGKPLIQGAVHGETLSAIVRRWNLRNVEAACPACALGAADWANLTARQGCDVRTVHAVGTIPTQTVPFVCATAGQMAAAEVLKVLMAEDAPAGGLEVLYSLQTHRILSTELERRAACRCPHLRCEINSSSESPAQITLADLILRSSGRAITDWQRLEVSAELPWCHFTTCAGCDRLPPIRRFALPGDPVGRCDCGATLTAQPLGMRQVIPCQDLMHRAGQTLAEAGLPSGRGIVIDDGESQPMCTFVGPLDDVPDDCDGAPSTPVFSSPEHSLPVG